MSSGYVESFLRGVVLACVLLMSAGCDKSGDAEGAVADAQKGPELLACEERLDRLTREVAELGKAHREEVRSREAKFVEMDEKLRGEIKEARAEATELERRIQVLQAETLRMSNETVVTIGNLKSRLQAAGRGASAGKSDGSAARTR